MRVAKYLASCGIGSRRKNEDLILAGKVKVNGATIDSPALNVEPSKDVILVNDLICEPKNKVYYLLNKPIGYTSTVADKHAEKLITELVPLEPPVWPVGRLDKETSGLIILTNDGSLTQKLTHPSHQKEKEYIAVVSKDLTDNDLAFIKNGITLDDGPVKAVDIEKIEPKKYRIILNVGKNRIVRRIFAHFGSEVLELSRTRIENLKLENLELGDFRELSEKEIKDIK